MRLFCCVREASSIVHLLPGTGTGSTAALCGFVPERAWWRTWSQDFEGPSEPIGICKPCWQRRSVRLDASPSREAVGEKTP